MMPGAIKAGIASTVAQASSRQENARRSCPGSHPIRALYQMTMALDRPIRAAGSSDAKNSCLMERLAMVPRTIIVMEGGIRIPVPADAATMQDAHSLR